MPLLLFAIGARRIPLTTLGLLQYRAVDPVRALISLLGERFGADRLANFALIWALLALYTGDGWRAGWRDAADKAAAAEALAGGPD